MDNKYYMSLMCLLSSFSWVLTQGTDYFHVESLSMCEEVHNQLVKFYLTPKDLKPGIQTVDINITSPKTIGENARLKCVGYLDVRKHWIRLFNFEDDFCYVFRTYVGQLFYDLERAAGIIPGSCPIPRGTYHAVNFTLDYQKLKLQSFPFGKLKYVVNVSDKTTKVISSCLNVIIVNRS